MQAPALLFFTVMIASGVAPVDEPPAPKITHQKSEDGTPGVKAVFYLQSDVDRVWRVVTDPKRGPELFDTVSVIRPSKRHPGLWEYHLKSPFGTLCVYCEVDKDRSGGVVRWTRRSGSLERFTGYFQVRAADGYPGYVRVEYGSYIEPGGLGGLLMTKKKRQRMVEKMIPRLRALTES
ncbi:MAG: SRPBCC family protein [Deltaproteobacteria bacterium]|nr:SRPBCC family protein [Deltaproteobacteria bacterium]